MSSAQTFCGSAFRGRVNPLDSSVKKKISFASIFHECQSAPPTIDSDSYGISSSGQVRILKQLGPKPRQSDASLPLISDLRGRGRPSGPLKVARIFRASESKSMRKNEQGNSWTVFALQVIHAIQLK